MRTAPGEAPEASGALQALLRLRGYARPHLGQLGLMLAGAGAGQGLGILAPVLTQRVIDGPVRHGTTSGLFLLTGLALLVAVGGMLSDFTARWAQASASVSIETALRTDLYAHLQRLPLAFHQRWPSGQLLSRATSDLRTVGGFLSFGSVFILLQTTTYLAVSVLLIRIYWPLGMVVAAGAVPIAYLTYSLSRQYLRLSRQLQDQLGDLSSLVEESVLGFRTIRAFGRHRHVNTLFAQSAGTVRDTGQAQGRLVAFYWPALEAVPGVLLAIVLFGGGYAVAGGALSVGELVAFIGLLVFVAWPLDSLGWLLGDAQQAATAAQRIYEVLDAPATIVDRPGAIEVRSADVAGLLRFERVRFQYPAEPRPVLRDVDLEVRPGETMALVGASGSGKTTLTMLVNRLYEVSGGRVTLDGRDIRDLRVKSLRTVICSAFEDPTLFSASVRENLTLGTPDATDEDVEAAIQVAQADFVHDLPWGLSTRIGEQGLSLSGGQRQRLALARAVVGRPRVLVLDDPLSAVDVETEVLVERALRTVLAGTTALLVVHRPSTVALADRVALVADGTIRAVGTHADLLATMPAYRDVLGSMASESQAALEAPR